QRQIGDYDAVSLLDTSTVEELVDNRRQLTNAPLPLSSVFSNKLTLTVHELSAQYFKSFSPNWLFVDGSTANFQLGLGRHGQFYLYQLPLIFIGGYFIARKNKKLGILLLLWVVLSAMPGAITKSGNFEYRNILLL